MIEYRHLRLPDKFIQCLDTGLRNIFANPKGRRKSPADRFDHDPIANDLRNKKKSAELMRVNHVGEICAQALYQGQALTARNTITKQKMQVAAEEEIDHLAWCQQRITQLDSHTSYLNPLWYTGALCIGIGAGLAGDKWSLGFVAETERQVVLHLNSHLERLDDNDVLSKAIIQQMSFDEAEHAVMAEESGAAALPIIVQKVMKKSAKIMTIIAAKI